MKKVLVTGATGFIGKRLVPALFREGYEVHVLSRNAEKAKSDFGVPVESFEWDAKSPVPPQALKSVDAVVHLAGEGIANKRWTQEQKRKIRDSRVLSTKSLFESIQSQPEKPKVVVSGSAIGIYGDRGDEELNETSQRGQGFLSDVCAEWEKEASGNASGLRLVILRTGVVLGSGGGMLSKLLPLFKLGLGGPVGAGSQWMSWVHVDDLVALILHSIKQDTLSGPVNGTAPHPVTNKEFSKALGKALHRPALFVAPAFGIKLAMGELSALVLDSQKVLPKSAEKNGFAFRYPNIHVAFDEIVKKKA